MKRTRRISIEVVRRELNLSVKRPVVAGAQSPQDATGQAGQQVQETTSLPTECPSCASPWFVLPAGDGEVSTTVQRALGKHGIHTRLSPTGELLVCGRSFELHVGAYGEIDSATSKSRSRTNELIAKKDPDHS
jgi:hypothetical protein